jgi:hypothetical protein
VSDNFLFVIPADPWHVPSATAQQAAKQALRRYAPKVQVIETSITSVPTFIDCGANLEHVACPHCGKHIDHWWANQMERVAAAGFFDLTITTSCCHRTTSLNDLRYEWPSGFACFTLEAMNPGVILLSRAQVRELQHILNCTIRQVLVHL